MVSTERRLSAARYREATPHYVALLVIAAAIIAVNLLWTHAQGGHGWLWRDATMGICFGRRCAPDQLNAQAAVALLAVAVLPVLLAILPLVAPTRWLAGPLPLAGRARGRRPARLQHRGASAPLLK